MRMRTPLLLLAFALTAAGCSIRPNDNTLPGQVAVGSDGYSIVANFDNIQNLVPNSTVQYHDVTVGTVASIRVDNWQAKVTLRLQKAVSLPSNATFKIGQKTLLGAQFIQIDDPANPTGKLIEGGTIVQNQTGSYPETEQVLAAASLLLNNGGLSQINTITTELNTALGGHETNTRDVIDKLNTLVGTLDSQRNNIVQALESLDALSARLAKQKEVVGTAIDKITPGLKVLNDERAKLTTAIDAVGRFGTVSTQLINQSQRALLGNLASLKPVLTQLNAAGDNLPKALKYAITLPFPVMTTQNAIKGDFANLFATIDVSLPTLSASFLGTAKGSPSQQATNPLTGPLQLNPSTLGALPSLTGPATPTPTAGSPTPGAASTPTPASCNFLQKILGGC